jgi:2-polyprenyl-3-methyl-5-hydroxy-6-metoxy-1,4-benzoquinol methylase
MKEESIRPAELMRECEELRRQDVERLLALRHSFVSCACPACGLADNRLVFEKKGFAFASCGGCGTVYVSPRPDRGALADYYTKAKSLKFWNERIFPASEDVRRKSIFGPRAELLARLCREHGINGGTHLDAGAGFGTFCEEIKGIGLFERVVAVEPSPGLASTCRKKGIETIESAIEDVEIGSADVITSFELVEHLFHPEEFLKSCRRALTDGGLLVITTPNIAGFDLKVLGPLSDNITAPNHLNYFNPGSLSLLLRKCGFRVLEVLTPGKLDANIVRNKILSGAFDVSSDPFLKHVLIDEWDRVGEKFQDFLADNLLSSHMWAVAEKVNELG